MTSEKPAKPHLVSTRISDDVLAMVDRIARERDRSRAWVLASLIERAARHETAFFDFIEEGQNGPWLTHDELLARLAERQQALRAA